MKKAIVVFICPRLLRDFNVFIKSLIKCTPYIKHNSVNAIPIIAIETNMSNEYKLQAEKIYKNIIWKKPKYENYKDINFSLTIPKGKLNYYKLGVYSYDEYDQLFMFDTDMIVMKNIGELFEKKIDFGAVGRYDPINDRIINDFNGGLIVIGKKYLNQKTYQELLEIAKRGHKFSEQCVQNIYFKNKIEHIDKKFNCEKRMYYAKNEQLKNIWDNKKILHIVGPKLYDKRQYADGNRFDVLKPLFNEYDNYKFKHYKIIIVGSAPSIMQKENGECIDNFGIVIRINNYKIKGYEKYTGTKTDYLIFGYCSPRGEWQDEKKYCFCADKYNDLEFVQQRMDQDNINSNFIGCKEKIENVNILDEYYYYGLNAKLNYHGKQRPTTGVVAIEWALENFPYSDIYYTGIDFFQGDKNQKHYFDYVTNKNDYHDHEKEKKYIEFLKKEEKIWQL